MRHIAQLAITFLLACTWISTASASTIEERETDFDLFVAERADANNVAGTAIAIIQANRITHTASFGIESTLTEIPIDSATVFQAASISKAVTAWGIMRLVQEGRLDLDAPVSTYLTRWQLPPSSFRDDDVTLRRVLSHTAGLSLPSYVGFDPAAELPSFESSLSGATNGSGALALVAQPGEQFSYSGGGYTLLGLIIEEVSGQPFADYMAANILLPLGMESSSYLPDEEMLARIAQAHDFHRHTIPNYRLAAQGAGSLHTSAEDLGKFAIANMSDNPVLTRETLREMHTPIINTGLGNQMGLGFFIEEEGQLVGHRGSNRGWKARVQFSPTSGDGLVVLTNSESGEALIDETFCYWNKSYQIGLLSAACTDQQDQRRLLTTLGWLTTVFLASIILALAMRFLSGLLVGNRTFTTPTLKDWQSWVLIFLLGLSVAQGLFLYTGYGVWLIAGIPWGFSVANHAPQSVQYAFKALFGLYVALAASMLARRKRDQ